VSEIMLAVVAAVFVFVLVFEIHWVLDNNAGVRERLSALEIEVWILQGALISDGEDTYDKLFQRAVEWGDYNRDFKEESVLD
jgi:hypothetical protein